jgi:biofilm PGA synthesis N-glycosyltransferase PgaC
MTTPNRFMPVERAPGRRYCLVTPCRNEANFIRRTLETTCAQTVLPSLWVIVDDGSTDETPQILAEFAARYPFIQIVKRADRGRRAVGPGVIEAFYDGLARVDLDSFDYVTKFDGDLELPPRYFERSMERMEADARLGNVSGKLFERLANGTLFEERTGDENAVGPVKFYRVACFKHVGGFVHEVAWDGIDGHVCRLNGWIAQSVDDVEMRIIHLRPMGSSQDNIRVGRIRWGRGKYFMGSAWYYVLASAVYRSLEPPYLYGGIGIMWGYLRALLTGHPRYENPAYRRYLRRFERNQLLMGKSRALQRENERVRALPRVV